jgi:hypothetical protein
MTYKKIESGTVIKIENQDHLKMIEVLIKDHETAQVAFQQAAKLIKTTNSALWRTILSIYPELKDWHSIINHDTKNITAQYKINKGKGRQNV